MGIIPTEAEKYIEDLLDDDNKGKLKYIYYVTSHKP